MNLHSPSCRSFFTPLTVFAFLLVIGIPAASATTTEVTNSGPTVMDAGGGAYQVSSGTVNLGASVYVGQNNAYNVLTIKNGATLENYGTIAIGQNAGSEHNQIIVTGPGSVLMTDGYRLSIGIYGNNNSISVTDGGFLTTGESVLGDGGSSSYDSVLISGANSRWDLSDSLYIGHGSGSGGINDSSHDTVTISGGALIKIDAGLHIAGLDNTLQLNGGFLALNGDQTGGDTDDIPNLITGGLIQGDGLHYQYFDGSQAAEAQAFSGYSGLAGYTIVTSAVPEPATASLLAGLCVFGLACWRPRHRKTRRA